MARPRALHIQNEVTDPCVPFVEALEAEGFDVETVHAYADGRLPEILAGSARWSRGAASSTPTEPASTAGWRRRSSWCARRSRRHALHGPVPGSPGADRGRRRRGVPQRPAEVGWHEVELLPAADDDPLFGALPQRFTTMQWHYYACRPNGAATELATNSAALAGPARG